jgi:methylated-DNA-[protein]-cysteine S-methyltransferase
MTTLWHCDSPLGGITLAGRGDALAGLWLEGQHRFAATLPDDCPEAWLPVFGQVCRWLDRYFSGRVPDFTPPLDLAGTPFQRRVWEELISIPYGQTITYGALARRLGSSARAVGGAVGRNPVSLIVPCHRVVGAGGWPGGYAGGLDRKLRLLQLESTGTIF